MMVGADILIMPVLHAEPSGDRAQLDKAKAFIEMAGVDVRGHHCIELQHPKAMEPSLLQAV